MTTSIAVRPSLAEVLAEDLRTTWVPDVLGNVDVELLLNTAPAAGTLGDVEQFEVPRPDSSPLLATALSHHGHGLIHRSVDAVRGAIDARLAPGVCGYRRGAEEGFSYSTENRRFQELTESEAADAAYVVFADVRTFFANCTWSVVLDQLEQLVPEADLDEVRHLSKSAAASGVHTLPAGYADARLLANAVLAAADDAIGLPFARWVDDYRIFAPGRREAELTLERLQAALGQSGHTLNGAKISIVPAAEVGTLRGLPLESVYHPDTESPDHVRAALRTIFLHAVQNHPPGRRELRFTLPRLAEQHDDIALDWVLSCLDSMPWEAPRFAVYLHAFGDRPVVRSAVERALLTAVRDETSPWLAIRLAALACHTGVSDGAEKLAATARRTRSVRLWGLLLRGLALSGHKDLVASLTTCSTIPDARAALAARRDVDLPTGHLEDSLPAATLPALGDGVAPLPMIDSIL